MTDITAQLIKIQAEETDYRSAISEGTLTRIGAAINWIIENTSQKVGDVQTSMLTETQFQASRDNKWVLMDGRDVTGSDYAILTGNTVIPDARATVLRMKDNARALDPAGDAALGSYQADQIAAHRHFWAVAGAGSTGLLTANNTTNHQVSGSDFTDNLFAPTATEPTVGRTSNVGSAETRAKATIVNYFIKINS